MSELRLDRKLVLGDEQAGHLVSACETLWLETRLFVKLVAWYRNVKAGHKK